MGLGLLFVFFKLGRPQRSWSALLRPRSSWMTRELYAIIVFFRLLSFEYFGRHFPFFKLPSLLPSANSSLCSRNFSMANTDYSLICGRIRTTRGLRFYFITVRRIPNISYQQRWYGCNGYTINRH